MVTKLDRLKRRDPGTPSRVRDILSDCTALLENARIEEARLLCEIVVSHVLGTGRLELHIMANASVAPASLSRIRKSVARLAAGEPLQYVLGSADFMGRLFKVGRHCLIPRPETEELVEFVLGFGPLWQKPKPMIADVGTGSGCIAVSLAAERPKNRYIAIDISRKALEVAKANATAHGVGRRIRFKAADILSGIRAGSLDAVISNPPYVRTGDFDQLAVQVRGHEPRIALDAGERGLDVIAPLVVQAFRALKPGGFLFMEIGEGQWKDVKTLLAEASFSDSIVKKDLAGKNRMVRAEKRGST